MGKPTFSGHESFACKSHWLKRGYDFILAENNFNSEDAVVKLGVGKNMVASIKFWMKAFGLLDQDGILTSEAHYLLSNEYGHDPFFEDLGSLWLMHFLLVNSEYATIYNTTFIEYHRQRNIIERAKLQNFIKHTCFDDTSYTNLYNENTIKRDVNVMLHNYYVRSNANIEDSNALLAPLNLLQEIEKDTFVFNYDSRSNVPYQILLYALLTKFPDSMSISFESIQELALIFCLTNNDLMSSIRQVCEAYPKAIVFSDVAGIKELQFKQVIAKETVLNNYYLNK